VRTVDDVHGALEGHPVSAWVLAVHTGPTVEVDCVACNEVHIVVLCEDCGVAGAVDTDEVADVGELCDTLAGLVAALGLTPRG
jgi:hypothetical protein